MTQTPIQPQCSLYTLAAVPSFGGSGVTLRTRELGGGFIADADLTWTQARALALQLLEAANTTADERRRAAQELGL